MFPKVLLGTDTFIIYFWKLFLIEERANILKFYSVLYLISFNPVSGLIEMVLLVPFSKWESQSPQV